MSRRRSLTDAFGYPLLGVRVRLRGRTICGWQGAATSLGDGRAIKDGRTDLLWGEAEACPHEWVILRDQTPNPEHAAAIASTARGTA